MNDVQIKEIILKTNHFKNLYLVKKEEISRTNLMKQTIQGVSF